MGNEGTLSQPVIVKKPGLIILTGVAENGRDDLAGAAVKGQLYGTGKINAGGQTDGDPLVAEQMVNQGHRGLVIDPVRAVHGESGKVPGYASLTDALGD